MPAGQTIGQASLDHAPYRQSDDARCVVIAWWCQSGQGRIAILATLKGPHPLDEEIVLGTDVQGDGGHGRGEPRHVWCPPALEGVGASER